MQAVCGAGWGACAAARLCVGMARASRGEKRAPRACAGCGPPVPPVGKPAVCVCVRHTARRRLWGVWVRLVRRLRGKEGRARCDATQPVVDRRLRSAACACACVRRAEGEGAARASWSHKCLRAGVGHYQRTKRKPTGGCARSQRGGACASARPPRSRRGGGACPSAARVRTKKKNARKAAAHGSTGAEGAFRASEGSGEGGW